MVGIVNWATGAGLAKCRTHTAGQPTTSADAQRPIASRARFLGGSWAARGPPPDCSCEESCGLHDQCMALAGLCSRAWRPLCHGVILWKTAGSKSRGVALKSATSTSPGKGAVVRQADGRPSPTADLIANPPVLRSSVDVTVDVGSWDGMALAAVVQALPWLHSRHRVALPAF